MTVVAEQKRNITNFQDYVNKCKRELVALGFNLSPHIKYSLNNRLKRSHGRCLVSNTREYIEIQINLKYYLVASEMDLLSTIMHELLHTLPNCITHKAPWSIYAEKVNKAYGYNIRALSTSKEYNYKPDYKYALRCTICGETTFYQRKGYTIKNYKFCKCLNCNSPMGTIELLDLSKNNVI